MSRIEISNNFNNYKPSKKVPVLSFYTKEDNVTLMRITQAQCNVQLVYEYFKNTMNDTFYIAN
jgi:hypothetical protein